MTIAAGGGLVLRALADGDVPLLARWRADPRVAEWYEGPRDEASVRAKYLGDPARAHVTHALAEREGVPVGYAQWYALDAAALAAAGEPPGEGVAGIDLHVDPDLIGQGVGTALVRLVARHLVASGARRVLIDPETANTRAIRSYEKAGFRALRVLPAFSERAGERRDNLLMEWSDTQAGTPA